MKDLKGKYKSDEGLSYIQAYIIADCYEGKAAGKLKFKQPVDGPADYLLQIGFDNINLKQLLSGSKVKDASHHSPTSGKINGSLSISGWVGNNYSRIGRCRLQITDMQIGKLSAMAKLLDVLKLNEPTDFIFEQMVIDSYIRHNELFFEKVDLSGKNLAFKGRGSMNLGDQNIDLTLTARGRRLANSEPSVLQSLTEGLSPAVARLEVTGNLYDPEVTTKRWPVIKDSLGILGTKQH